MTVFDDNVPVIVSENMNSLFLRENFDFVALSSMISIFWSEYSVVVDKVEESANSGSGENSFVRKAFCSFREAILSLRSKYIIMIIY
jgi:hypothetical protein